MFFSCKASVQAFRAGFTSLQHSTSTVAGILRVLTNNYGSVVIVGHLRGIPHVSKAINAVSTIHFLRSASSGHQVTGNSRRLQVAGTFFTYT